MAAEGNFSNFKLTAPDETDKQRRETNRQVSALKENSAYQEKNREIYLRAQKFAQGVELDSMDKNFQFEQENRQEFIDRKKENMDALLAENEAKSQQKAETYKALGGLAKGALEAYTAIQKQNQANRMNAATGDLQLTGMTMQQLQSMAALNRNLTEAELLQNDQVRAIIGTDAPDEVKEAIVRIYKGSGSYEYIHNKALVQNTAYAYGNAANEFILNFQKENPDASTEEVQAAYLSWDADWRVTTSGVNGQRLRPEFLSENREPIINRERTRITARFQAERAKENESLIENKRQVTLGTIWSSDGGKNHDGLTNYLVQSKSADSREAYTTFAINSAKSSASGSMTVDDLKTVLDQRMTGMPGNPRFEDQFPAEAAQITAAIRQITNINRQDSNNRLADQKLLYQLELREMLSGFMQDSETPGILTKQELEKAEIRAMQLDPSTEFAVIKQAKKMTRYAQAKEEVDETLTKLRAQGNLTTDRVLEMNLPEEIETFWLSQAKQITDFRNGPKAQQFDREILTLLKSPAPIKVNPNGDAKNVSVLTMAGHYTRLRNTRYATLISEGMSPTAAADAATAETLSKVREMIASEGSIDATGYTGAAKIDANRKDEAKALLNRTAAVREFRALPSTDQYPQDIVQALDQNKYKAYITQMQSGSPIPQEVRAHAEIMRLTPLEWVNYIAPALQVEPITLPNELKDWETYLQQVEPETRNLFTLNPTDERVRRGVAIRQGLVQELPRRETFNSTAGVPLSTYRSQVSSITYDDGQPGIDLFFEDHKFPAVLPGQVKDIGYQVNTDGSGYGHYMVIESVDPATGEPVDVLYGHLPTAPQWEIGTPIAQGQIIGEQGGTGSVQSYDGTIASIDFLAPAPRGSGSMTPYTYYEQLREAIAQQFR